VKLKFFSVLLLTICLFQTLLFSADSEDSKRILEEKQEWLKQTKDIRPSARIKSGTSVVSRKKRSSSSKENSVFFLATLLSSMASPSGEGALNGNRKERRAHLQKNISETSF